MIRILSQEVSPKCLLLMMLEGIVITSGLLCGVRLRFWTDAAEFQSYIHGPWFFMQAFLYVITFQLCFYYSDLYDQRSLGCGKDRAMRLGQSLGAGAVVLGLMYFTFPSLLIGRGIFFISTAAVAAFVFAMRTGLDQAWHVAVPKQKILILGSQRLALTTARELNERPDLNVEVIGRLASAAETGTGCDQTSRECPVLGVVQDVERIVQLHGVSRIVIAMEDERGSLPIRDLVKLRVQGVRVEDAHTTVAALHGRIWLDMVRPSWFIFSNGFRRSRTTLITKRIVDLTFGLFGLIVSFPVMLLVAAAVRLDSKGPVIFSQTRVGLKGRQFDVLKFRSMRVDAEATGAQWAQKNDSRVTRVGKYLRKYRLDELPQFINVIRGDMSFVGPRPERPVFVDRLRNMISYYDERHSVRPGLTGWAQVQYPYGSSVEDAARKLEYDLFYLKNMSLGFDIMIVLKTLRTMLTGSGAR